jgi:hypothetical protein
MPSAETLVLDTHVFLWFYAGVRVSRKVVARIERAAAANGLHVAAMTPWEIAMAARAGRIRVRGNMLQWLETAPKGATNAGGRRARRRVRLRQGADRPIQASTVLVALLLLGCGSRTELSGGRSASGVTPAPNEDGGATCPLYARLTTRPGPCSAQGIECDSAGSTCGSCPDSLSCFDGRCYSLDGPGADLGPVQPDLLRSLYDEREGELCTLQTSGAIERVEAALWNDGARAISMEVFVTCGSSTALAATVTLSASDFPAYTAVAWRFMEHRTTTFVLDPPIDVHAGDVVKVLFHALGSSQYASSAVEAASFHDPDPHCQFVQEYPAGSPVALPNPENWDFKVRLYVHG